MDWALAAIKQSASLSSGTGNSLDLIFLLLLLSTYTKILRLLEVKFLTGV